MNKIKFAVCAGLIYGILDIIPMFFIDLPEKRAAILGAFINRFAIGFTIPLIDLGLKGWQKGVLLGALLSLTDAIITKAYAPILSFGILGGLIIGILADRYEKRRNTAAA